MANGRHAHIMNLLSRPSAFGNETGLLPNGVFEPGPHLLDCLKKKVLVIGAGGLGCELLKDLALSGFNNIHVIDMDTIDVSNLNRQFLFREGDVGKSKAATAANFIMLRVPGVLVTSYTGRVQDKNAAFYRQFSVVISGLDNIEARRWINSLLVSLVSRDDEGEIVPESIIPLIDGGTEGLQGQARVIIPKVTSCFECTLSLFPPQKAFPMCTIASTPRIPEHCIAYAYIIEWDKQFPTTKLDKDSPEHMTWVYNCALERAKQFNIEGVTYFKTLGVVKNIIPAVASTNAIIAAACVNEAFKLLTYCGQTMNTYMMYMGAQGVYTTTFDNERNPTCIVCSDAADAQAMNIASHMLLSEFIELLCNDPKLQLRKPSLVGEESGVVYMRGPLEATLRPNLDKSMSELIVDGEILTVTDPTLSDLALSIQVTFTLSQS